MSDDNGLNATIDRLINSKIAMESLSREIMDGKSEFNESEISLMVSALVHEIRAQDGMIARLITAQNDLKVE